MERRAQPRDPGPESADGLDEEHRELLRQLGAVLAAVAADDGPGATRLLDRLRAELEDHFAVEQGRMVELEDPALPRHREAHEAFLEDLGRLRRELGERGLSPLVRLWLSTRSSAWLRYHARIHGAALARAARRG